MGPFHIMGFSAGAFLGMRLVQTMSDTGRVLSLSMIYPMLYSEIDPTAVLNPCESPSSVPVYSVMFIEDLICPYNKEVLKRRKEFFEGHGWGTPTPPKRYGHSFFDGSHAKNAVYSFHRSVDREDAGHADWLNWVRSAGGHGCTLVDAHGRPWNFVKPLINWLHARG